MFLLKIKSFRRWYLLACYENLELQTFVNRSLALGNPMSHLWNHRQNLVATQRNASNGIMSGEFLNRTGWLFTGLFQCSQTLLQAVINY